MDKYEFKCRMRGTKVMLLALIICSVTAALIRGIHGEDVRDIVFVLCGSAGTFQVYMSIKSKKYNKYLALGIILLAVAIMALIKWIE